MMAQDWKHVRVSDKTLEILKAIAENEGISVAELVQRLANNYLQALQ
jgi:predicted DNA-binding ribbon-helix-helix protein